MTTYITYYSYAGGVPSESNALYARVRSSSMTEAHKEAVSDAIVLQRGGQYDDNPPRLPHPAPPKICGPICIIVHPKKDRDSIYLFLWKIAYDNVPHVMWEFVSVLGSSTIEVERTTHSSSPTVSESRVPGGRSGVRAP